MTSETFMKIIFEGRQTTATWDEVVTLQSQETKIKVKHEQEIAEAMLESQEKREVL
jgi:hypothetical protein